MIKRLIQLAVVGLLVALAIPSSRSRLVDPISNQIKNKITPRKVEVIAEQLFLRMQRGDGLPAPQSWENWLQSSSAGSSTDAWGNVYYLERRSEGFTVGSMGQDGIKGTADDFTVRRGRR